MPLSHWIKEMSKGNPFPASAGTSVGAMGWEARGDDHGTLIGTYKAPPLVCSRDLSHNSEIIPAPPLKRVLQMFLIEAILNLYRYIGMRTFTSWYTAFILLTAIGSLIYFCSLLHIVRKQLDWFTKRLGSTDIPEESGGAIIKINEILSEPDGGPVRWFKGFLQHAVQKVRAQYAEIVKILPGRQPSPDEHAGIEDSTEQIIPPVPAESSPVPAATDEQPASAHITAPETIETNGDSAELPMPKLLTSSRAIIEQHWDQYTSAAKSSYQKGWLLPDFTPFFSEQTIVSTPAARVLAGLTPGFLVALGILGTFIGLAAGLEDLSLDGELVSSETISQLVGGIHTAFYTSIAGIGSSIVWSLLDRWQLRLTTDDLYRVHGELRRVLPLADSSGQMNKVISTINEIQASTVNLAEEIGSSIAEGFNEALTGPPGQELAKEIGKQLTEGFSGVLAGDTGEKFAEHLDKAMAGQMIELRRVLEEIIEWHKVMKVETSDLLDQIVSTAHLAKRSLDQSNRLVDNLDEIGQAYSTAMESAREAVETWSAGVDRVGLILAEVGTITEQLAQGATQAELAAERVNENLDKAQELWERMSGSVQQMDEILGETTSELGRILDEGTGSLEKVLQDGSRIMADNLHGGLDRTFKQFDQHLADVSQRLGSVIADLRDVVPELPENLRNLQAALIEGTTQMRGLINASKEAAATEEAEAPRYEG